MTVIHVEPTQGDYATIQAAANASLSGDTIRVHPAIYNERIDIPQRRDVSFLAEPGAILDGGGTLGAAFYAFNASTAGIKVDGFEVRNYRSAGIKLAGGLAYALTRHVVTNNYIHGITGSVGNSYGIWVNGGNPTVTGNWVHDVGWMGESTGIWAGSCHHHTISDNQIWNCRKEGIRDYRGLAATITSNRAFRCGMAGIATNTSISPLVANNVLAFCHNGLNPKHVNAPPGTLSPFSFWTREDPELIEWGRYWHNTIYRCSHADILLDGAPAQTRIDIQNNIFAGRGGVAFSGNCLDPKVVDHNVYDTSDPARFLYDMPYGLFGGKAKTLEQLQTDLGWELNGRQLDAGLIDPLHGDFDTSSVLTGAELPTQWGTQVGARGLSPAKRAWTPALKTVDSAKSKGYAPGYKGHLSTNDEFAQSSLTTGSPPGTNGAADEWIIYDFGQATTINGMNLTVAGHAVPTNVKRFTVETGDDLLTWTTQLDAGESGTDSNLSGFPLQFPDGDVTCRYVRFTAVSNWGNTSYPYLVISDVQVGMLAPPPVPEPPAPLTELEQLTVTVAALAEAVEELRAEVRALYPAS